ncbi:BAI1-associated protein 3 isoform X1 [Chiloscyllium punctatum]|uniref:BAI1-associated protein 3 isoform X1 n=1 Tax=Chiloscyllium punctatum TaxID=137246 RepID=UPI003B63DA40
MHQLQSCQSVRRTTARPVTPVKKAYSTADELRTVEEGDGDFFEKLIAIQQKQENMQHHDYTQHLGDLSESLPPQATGHKDKLEIPHGELLLLCENVLYTVIHRTGVPSTTHITDQDEMLRYLRKVFRLDENEFEAVMHRVKEAKVPSWTLKVIVVEARNLLAKDANGFSDPYCMLGITMGQTTRETEEKKERKFSFRKKKDRMEKKSSLREVLPAKYIQATDVKSSTLNPVWNESYMFDLDDLHSDQLHLDIWDHDDEVSVVEACKNLNQISGLKGMGRYFKQIVKSARTNGAMGSQEENDDFLGCLDIPISDIPVGGINDWFKLEPRKSSSRVQGDCHLILTLIMSQRDTELCKRMCGMRIHELLLRQLLEIEHSDFQDDQNSWSGKLSKHAVTILAHHAMQFDLSFLQKAAVEWQAYSKHHQLHFMDSAFLLQLLEELDQMFHPGVLTKDQEEFLSDSFVLFIDYNWELLQRMKQVFPFNCPTALRQLELMLRCLSKIYSMEAFNVVCPLHNQLHVEIVAIVKKFIFDWYKKMCDTFKPNLKSGLTKQMRLVQLVDAVCTELHKDRENYNQIFVSVLKIDYFSITYQQLEKLVADDILTLMEELGTTMEQERSRMTQEMGETLFELYLSLKELKRFKEYLQLKDSQLLALTNFHDWFQMSINKWLQIVYEKSCERITRAVSVDQFEPVDTLSKHSSSAVDVVTCFTQIKSFWLQLAWPDPMGAFVFVTKITDDICNAAVMYSEKVRQKADSQKKITQQLCIALNNIQHVHSYTWNLPKELDWQGVEASMEQLCGLEGKQQVQRALGTQLQSIDAGMQRQSNYMINQLVEKMVTDLRKYIQHISLSPDSIQPDEAVCPLMKFLDDNLIILSEWLVMENLRKILSALWTLLLDLITEALAINTGMSTEFYERFHFTLEALVVFFHAEGQGLPLDSLQNDKYKALKEELRLNKCSTQELVEYSYQAKIRQQKSTDPGLYGMLCIKCHYDAAESKLCIEVLHATNLIALDANGLSDPFVIIKLAPLHFFPGSKSQQTQVKNKTLHPIFDELFIFTVTQEQCSNNTACVHFTVMDHDWLSTNDFAGEAVLQLQEVPGFNKPAIAGGIKNVSPVFLKLTHPEPSVMKPIMKMLEGRAADREAQDFVKMMKELEVSPD